MAPRSCSSGSTPRGANPAQTDTAISPVPNERRANRLTIVPPLAGEAAPSETNLPALTSARQIDQVLGQFVRIAWVDAPAILASVLSVLESKRHHTEADPEPRYEGDRDAVASHTRRIADL